MEPTQYLYGDEHTLKAATVAAERANIEACPGMGTLPPHNHLLRSFVPEMQVILVRQVPGGIKSFVKTKKRNAKTQAQATFIHLARAPLQSACSL